MNQHNAANDALSIRAAHPSERHAWDMLVLQHCNGNVLQTWGWGESKERYGWQAHRLLALDAANVAVGALQILFKPVAGGMVSFAYAPRGPALAESEQRSHVAQKLIAAGVRMARHHRTVVFKMDPEWSMDDKALTTMMRTAGLRDNAYDIQHRKTYIVDLQGGEDAVFAKIKASTRHHIRRAQSRGVVVDIHPNAAGLDLFYPLLTATSERKQFIRRDISYYRTMIDSLSASCPVVTMVASVQGEPVSGLIAAAAGPRLCFLFGGSTMRHSDSFPTYLLHWTNIQWGLQHGCTFYDMWGVPNHEDPSAPGAGYYDFKSRWNGVVTRHHRCQDVPLWPALGPLPQLAERIALRGRSFAD